MCLGLKATHKRWNREGQSVSVPASAREDIVRLLIGDINIRLTLGFSGIHYFTCCHAEVRKTALAAVILFTIYSRKAQAETQLHLTKK